MATANPMVNTRQRGHRLLIGSLAITQTVGYGVLSYAFAVFLTPMAHDLHTGPTALTAALTLAVLIAAAAAIPVGRWIDGHGGRTLMVTGSILGTLAVLAWSTVDNLLGLYLVFVLIG